MKFLWSNIEARTLPYGTLLTSYADAQDCYTDCYTTDIAASVDLPEFVTAFYTTRLFKIERMILKLAASRSSTDVQARELGMALIDRFAAWRVEKRTERQLLMCDLSGRTRSWFMVEANHGAPRERTRLYFGSAVVPAANKETGKRTLGRAFDVLLGFHKLYSRALLSAARSKLER
ncbi:MAG: hypothetical protein ACR2PA_04915 [Hyphomicrobiaceae bacterium]